jgi:orotidine-5'-phosphate decarboxylase
MATADRPDARRGRGPEGQGRAGRPASPIVVALDFADPRPALAVAAALSPELCALKVGKELFTAAGPELVRALVGHGYRVFLDLKFHDIPNTVAQACAAATRLGVWMVNVHASGGSAMLRAAREAVDRAAADAGVAAPLLIGVTVLTSLDASALAETGVARAPAEQVVHLARLCAAAALDGVVCSAQEASALRAALGSDFCLVTPGIRPAGVDAHDQARVMTPEAAVAAGADYLVIGRAITQAPAPREAVARILESIGAKP